MGCDHNCDSCGQKCDKKDLLAPMNKNSNIRNVVAIISGKGGVGKSLVTSLLAVNSVNLGYDTAILDADITGPSIPMSFGVEDRAYGSEEELYPQVTSCGIKIMSSNLLLDNTTDPVILRGPVIAGMIKQFYSDCRWENVDNMFVDCPPGTGDVPLTVFQSLPVKGIVIVTSPQDLVSMIVAKAVNMAKMMDIPIIGLVENMSYFVCPNCNEKHYIYGQSKIDEVAKEYGIDTVVKLPINPKLAKLVDAGEISNYLCDELDPIIEKISKLK